MSDREIRAGASITVVSNQTTQTDPRTQTRGALASLTLGASIRPAPEVQSEYEAEVMIRPNAHSPSQTISDVIMYVALDPTWNGRRAADGTPVKNNGTALDQFDWTRVGILSDNTGESTLDLPITIPTRLSPRWEKIYFQFTANAAVDIFLAKHKERVS